MKFTASFEGFSMKAMSIDCSKEQQQQNNVISAFLQLVGVIRAIQADVVNTFVVFRKVRHR